MNRAVAVRFNPRAGQTMTFLSAPSESVQRFRLELEPVFHGPPLHRHPAATESFAVVAGSLAVRVERQWRALTAGEEVGIPPGTIHTYANRSGAAVVVDVSIEPGREMRGFFEALHDLADEEALTPTGGLRPRQAAHLFLRYPGAMTVVGPPESLQPVLWRLLAGRRA
ncbi:cupin domain-containing protein [Arthrobacter sp. L77]|uniref:cupin domain-containing protein n=1 Tax=Arthrobacter sp. L77 TaxID=1496689 RepID=UPI0005BB9863|nr:cupin domain-containing protein [Arthrobacter sp. L77]